MTDGTAIAIFVNITPRLDDLPNKAIVEQLHVTNESRIGTALCTVLDNAPVFFCRGHELAALVNTVG